jgi:hypothetical protein
MPGMSTPAELQLGIMLVVDRAMLGMMVVL